jgi:hypothetical protein
MVAHEAGLNVITTALALTFVNNAASINHSFTVRSTVNPQRNRFARNAHAQGLFCVNPLTSKVA